VANDLITPETLSKELLFSIFDAALMETSWDSNECLRVGEADGISCSVLPSEKKTRIMLLSKFGFKKTATQTERLECVNKINNEYVVIRASSDDDDTLKFMYYICVSGGLTAKNIVLTTKLFLSIPTDAIGDHGKDIVE